MEDPNLHVVPCTGLFLDFKKIVLIIVLSIATSFAYQIIYHHFFNPLAKFPGPFWAGVTRLWLAFYDLRGQEQGMTEALHAKYRA